MSLGAELREQRERRGVGLASISERTKVAERYLRALEDGEHEQLPGGIFNKGIVRSYCQQLDLDEEAWVQRFAVTFGNPGGEPDWTLFAENVRHNRDRAGASHGRWWGVLLMALGLATVAWVGWHYVVKPRLG